jgi:hypothetical protein
MDVDHKVQQVQEWGQGWKERAEKAEARVKELESYSREREEKRKKK